MRNGRLLLTLLSVGLFATSMFAGDAFRFNSPIGADHIFSAINGERTGYVELELVSSVIVDIENVDPRFHASALLKARSLFHVAFNGKVETTDADGKKQTRKIARFLRAGPGEQITLAFKVYDRSAPTQVAVSILYYDDSATLIGRGRSIQFSVYDNQPTSTVITFTRSDLE